MTHDPFGMLSACHDRIRRSLSLLREIGALVATGRTDVSVREAAADVLHYFDHAAPHHHEDEEQHVFPRVLASTHDGDVRAAVLKLQEEHLTMEAQWAHVRVPLAALANGNAEGYDLGQLAAAERFCALYGSHVQLEEDMVFPLASRLLDHASLQSMGEEMTRRRVARRQ